MHSAPTYNPATSSTSASHMPSYFSGPSTESYTGYHHHEQQNMSSYGSYASMPQGGRESDEDEQDHGEDGQGGDGSREGEERDESRGSRGSSHDQKDGVNRRKPRITLARGGACVVCRTRKLKCTGERPCRSCEKAGNECRYEEVQRRKPKAILLEERLAELEGILGLAPGEPVQNIGKRPAAPPLPGKSATSPGDAPMSLGSTPSLAPLTIASTASSHSGPPSLSLHSHRDLVQGGPNVNASRAEIAPNSPLELALISVVLPYTPFLLMPVHPQRFLALLSLPAHDPSRPHPALLYIMFAEAILILERGTPRPRLPNPPSTLFPHTSVPPMPTPAVDTAPLLQHVQGMSLSMLERARVELDSGIRNVDRPFDLARAAIAIGRHLYSLGRFIEGWNIPVSRLIVSCGLHRLTGNYTSPDGFVSSPGSVSDMPKAYAPAHYYPLASQSMTTPDGSQLPVLRMRPIILPPARDEIDVAERTATFWAAKMQDWEAGLGWGWTSALPDDECTTQWPWGWGVPEPKLPMGRPDHRFSLRDLHDPTSMAQQSPFPDTTYTLAVKSVGLLHRASHLFDLPVASYPVTLPDGRQAPTHIPPLASIKSVQQSLGSFRSRLPAMFSYHLAQGGSGSVSPTNSGQAESYDGFSDPWYILLHVNLYTAEMMMWKEMAHHQVGTYETAVGCARALVAFVRCIRPDQWVHVDMGVALNISLCSRFLFKESERLRVIGEVQGAGLAETEAESLRQALTGEYSRWMPMASLHALIVQRVREGWAEKEGEYERT